MIVNETFPRRLYGAATAGLLVFLSVSSGAIGQVDPLAPPAFRSGGSANEAQPLTVRWRVGVRLTGGSAAGKDVQIAIPIPTEWPEQQVILLEQQVSPQLQNFQVRSVDPGSTQIVARANSLQANQQLELILTFAVTVAPLPPPTETDSLKIPSRIGKDLKPYLENSREISYRHPKLTALVNEVVDREQPAWNQVRAIWDWIRDHIESREAAPTTTVDCFLNRGGAPEDVVGLFVAMCRFIKVPARMVWVEGTQYAEFYLVDEEGQGRWFPCHVVGMGEFGSLNEPRVIVQKGDAIKVPERELPQRFVAEFARVRGAAPAAVEFIQELLPAH